jgi:ABC-2 type transport system permease protein
MRWHRLAAMARKEVIQILRDWRSLVIVIALPIVQLLLFGYGISLDLKRLPACVWDQEGSQQSQDLLKRFAASKYFRIVGTIDNYAAATAALDAGRAKLVLVVPYDFSKRLKTGSAVKVQALVDATDDNTANLVFSYSEAVVRGFSAEMQLEFLRRQGQARVGTPLAVEARTWFNEELESRAFVVPGVVAIVMAVIGAFLTSLTIAREWERGTMEQLISTPVTPLEVMLGKLAPYFVIGMFDTALCTAFGVWLFEVPFRGQLTTLFGSSALFLVVVLGLGYLISVIAKTQLAASQIALITTFLPAFLLSGFLFAIEQMPVALQWFTRIIPARYYVAILKSVFLKGATVAALKGEVLALAVFAVLVATLARRAFQKRLA